MTQTLTPAEALTAIEWAARDIEDAGFVAIARDLREAAAVLSPIVSSD